MEGRVGLVVGDGPVRASVSRGTLHLAQTASGTVVAYTDSDFGAILALSGAAIPSVLLRGVGDTVDEQVDAVT